MPPLNHVQKNILVYDKLELPLVVGHRARVVLAHGQVHPNSKNPRVDTSGVVRVKNVFDFETLNTYYIKNRF